MGIIKNYRKDKKELRQQEKSFHKKYGVLETIGYAIVGGIYLAGSWLIGKLFTKEEKDDNRMVEAKVEVTEVNDNQEESAE